MKLQAMKCFAFFCIFLFPMIGLSISVNAIVDSAEYEPMNRLVGESSHTFITLHEKEVVYPKYLAYERYEPERRYYSTKVSSDVVMRTISNESDNMFSDKNYAQKLSRCIFNREVVYVPDDYPTIQDAVDNVSIGGMIIVRNGSYSANVVINKSLTVMSEWGYKNCSVKQRSSSKNIFTVTASDVDISGFKLIGKRNEAAIYFAKVNNCVASFHYMKDFADGIRLNKCNNMTIHSNILGAFWDYQWRDIWLQNSHNNSIYNNTIREANLAGIFMRNSDNNNIFDNDIRNNNYGIIIEYFSENNTIADNWIYRNFHGGLNSYECFYNLVVNNTIERTEWDGLYLLLTNYSVFKDNRILKDSPFLLSSYHNVWDNTTVNGLPFVCLEFEKDVVVTEPAGAIVLVKCENVTIWDQYIGPTGVGIEIYHCDTVRVFNSTIRSSYFEGIYSILSNNNTFQHNNFTNSNVGVSLLRSHYNNVSWNEFTAHDWYGVYTYESDFNTVWQNVLHHNFDPIYLDEESDYNIVSYNEVCHERPESYGIKTRYSRHNVVSHNFVMDFTRGIVVTVYSDTVIADNIVVDCDDAIEVDTHEGTIQVLNNQVSNSYRGIWIVSSLETEIIGNEIFDTKRGVLIEGSITKTRVSNNTIRDNELGIYVMLGFNTQINRNNFIDNQLEATFSSFGFILGRINWNYNYWGKVLHHPKFILGTVFILPWIQIDWRPAQEPYDFGGVV